MLTLLILVIVVALVFDYINGFHNAANAIATVVSTGVLPVRTAVIMAAVLNFVGAMVRLAQLVSACLMAFSHGSNDAQKAMGIITLALISYTQTSSTALPHWVLPHADGSIPRWVIVACALSIAGGTLAGGERIIKTMGSKIIRITPLHGFAAELSGAATVMVATHFGVPVSTTHCINACIMGVGASKRLSAVRWGVAGNILVAWILTLPISAALAYGFNHVIARVF